MNSFYARKCHNLIHISDEEALSTHKMSEIIAKAREDKNHESSDLVNFSICEEQVCIVN